MSKEKNKGHIFITVGNGKFEPLVKEVDRLKSEGFIKEDVVVQVGHGTYKPQNCKWFTFESPLDLYYNNANLVICHGGPGTVFEIMRRKLKVIALPNRDRTDPNHQVEYLRAMDKETKGMIYCDRVSLLKDKLEMAKTYKFAHYKKTECKMHEVIHGFLQKN